MGDIDRQNPKSPPPPPLSLPPGFRFHPTDHQLLTFYLTTKNKNPNLILSSTPSSPYLCLDVISEFDGLYTYDPYDLPEIDSFPYGCGEGKKHWYYFTGRGRGKRGRGGGYWKRKSSGSGNVVSGKDGELLGTKTRFVFYRRDALSRRWCRTNWLLIEYALIDHQMDFFVLSRVFLKTGSADKVIKAGINSQGEEIFPAKEDSLIGVPYRQFDRASVSGIGEVVVGEDAFDNEVIKLPGNLTTELNNHVAPEPFSDNGIGSSLCAQPDQLVNIYNRFVGSAVTYNDVAEELRTNAIFLEGDYLELDDLVGPLFNLDSSG